MLEPILKGLVQWLYEMMVDIMDYASGELLGVMSMDLNYFVKTAPVISEIVNVFVALGWALLLGNMVFQLTKSMMSGIGLEGEDPKIIFFRTFVFSFLLLASRQICEIGLSITGTVIDLLELPRSIKVTVPKESMFKLGGEAKWLLVIIVGVILMVQMVKLLFEIGERYVVMGVLTFFAPLAFSTGGSRNTSDIFKGWCRMYGSMMVMMIMNIVFLKLIMSAMSQMTKGGVLVWLVFVVALTRVARKIDSHIGKIGLNPAQTGDGIGSRFPGAVTMMAVRVMTSAIGKSIAANKSTGSSGNHGSERRHAQRGAAAGSRHFAGNRYAGGTNGGNTYSNTTNASHFGSQTTGGEQSNPSVYNSSSVNSRTAQSGNVQHQNGTFAGGPNKTAGNAPHGVHSFGGASTNPQSAGSPPSPAASSNTQSDSEKDIRYVNSQSRMDRLHGSNHPPLDRRTRSGSSSSMEQNAAILQKQGTKLENKSLNQQDVHSAERMKPVSGINPQFHMRHGSSENRITSANYAESDLLQNEERVWNKDTAVQNRTDVQNASKQNGENTAVNRQNRTSRSMMHSSEKISAAHMENNSGSQEIFHREQESNYDLDRQPRSAAFTERDREFYMEEQAEKRMDHAYKLGKYNPSAENRKAKQTYYQKQKSVEQKEYRGENNRKRKWEKQRTENSQRRADDERRGQSSRRNRFR